MLSQSKFSKDNSVKIVIWMCKLKDLNKVRWRYAKEKGIGKCPRKLPKNKIFKCVKHSNLDKLKELMSNFVATLDEEEVRRAVRDVRPWARLCTKMNLGHFESQLQKYKKGTIGV